MSQLSITPCLQVPAYLLVAVLTFQGLPTDAEKSAQQEAKPPDAVSKNPLIARIGTEELRLVDFIREVNQLIPLNFYHRKIPAEQMAEFRQKAFDSLALKRRIYLDAVDRELPIQESAIRARFKKAIQKAGPRYENLSEKDFTAELEKNRLLIRRIILTDENRARFKKTIAKVTEAGLRKVYEGRLKADSEAFRVPRKARLLHIFVKLDPSRAEKDLQRKTALMAEAKKELDKGTPFSQVARLYSEGDKAKLGGDLGWVKEGTLRSRVLDKAAFKMKAGEVSGVIESLYGLHILQCVEVKPLRTYGFDEVKTTLKLWLTKEHEKVSMQRWKEELEKKYPMKILAPDLIVPPEMRKAPSDSKEATKEAQPASRPASSQPASSQPASSQPMPSKPVPSKPDSRPGKG